jgi:hypothetical protein
VLDSSKVAACSAGIKAMGCGIEADSFPAVCDEAIAGQVAVGDACVINADCVGTAFCKLGAACPSVCTELFGEGDACAKDEECGDDLVCAGGKCAAPAGEGDACEGTTGKACAMGLVCWDATDEPPTAGVCHTTAETLVGALGDECSPGSTLCEEGLSCAYAASSGTQYACKARVGSGDSCLLALPGQCPVDEYCDTANYAEPGTCTPKPGEGEACLVGVKCAPSLVCVPDGKGGGICRPFQNNGGKCAIDDACRSVYCDAATCEPPVACE